MIELPPLNEMVHSLWLAEAAKGNPPPIDLVAREQYQLIPAWHAREAFYDLPANLGDWRKGKKLACLEMSRGAGKSVFTCLLRLYVAEYLLPFARRPDGSKYPPQNLRMLIFGREERHLSNEVFTTLKEMIYSYSPWLRKKDWRKHYKDGAKPLAEVMSKAQKWDAFRIDLTNGVSIRGHTIKQNVRGYHVLYADADDILVETNAAQSLEIMDLIRGAILPAIESGGLFLVCGTPQAPGDLYDIILNSGAWQYKAYPAIDVDGTLKYREKNLAFLGADAQKYTFEDLDSLWPWRLPMVALKQARGNTAEDEIKFQREYLLNRISSLASLVHPEDMIAAKDPTLSYAHRAAPGVQYYAGLDPSNLRKDDAGICIGTVASNGNHVIQSFTKIRANPHLPDGEGPMKVIQEINELSNLFGEPKWMIERNGFQGVLAPLLKMMRPGIRVDTIMLTSNKSAESGWLGIRTAFRGRKIKLPYQTDEDKKITDEFLHQLRGIQLVGGKIMEDSSRKNDLVSAFWLYLKATEELTGELQLTIETLKELGKKDERPRLPPNPETSPEAYNKRTGNIQQSFRDKVERINALRARKRPGHRF